MERALPPPPRVVINEGTIRVSGAGSLVVGKAAFAPQPAPKLWLDASEAVFTDGFLASWSNRVVGGGRDPLR